jgi:3-deoxy-7-phosphoheptulonate synthase
LEAVYTGGIVRRLNKKRNYKPNKPPKYTEVLFFKKGNYMNIHETLQKNTHVLRHDLGDLSHMTGLPVQKPERYLFSLEHTQGEKTVIQIGDILIGGPEVILMAGACAMENPKQMVDAAVAAKEAGAKILRGGAFKPRTDPYSFQGLGRPGLILQRRIADELGMAMVTEATGSKNLVAVAEISDIIQIGARNCQNFELLVEAGLIAGKLDKTILLKRGAGVSLSDFLRATEYILAAGCPKIILCERGSKMSDGTIDFDDAGVKELKKLTHLPVMGDPTHATQDAECVPELAHRAIQAGSDALIIEVHPKPEEALCDGKRALRPEQLLELSHSIVQSLPEGRIFNI